MAERRRGEGTKWQIDRKIFSSDIWLSGSIWKFRLWFYLMGHTNYKDMVWQGIKIKRGQLVCSYRRIANEIAYDKGCIHNEPSISTISQLFKELQKEKRIELASLPPLENQDKKDKPRTKRRGYLITLLNYNTLQGFITCVPNEKRTECKKDKTIYSLFEFWNSLKIITHKKIDKFASPLETALKDYSGFQIRKAMVNYSKITKGKEYFFNYRWTLEEFLVRGLDKFLDINKPLENFLIDKEGKTKEVYPKYEEKK